MIQYKVAEVEGNELDAHELEACLNSYGAQDWEYLRHEWNSVRRLNYVIFRKVAPISTNVAVPSSEVISKSLEIGSPAPVKRRSA